MLCPCHATSRSNCFLPEQMSFNWAIHEISAPDDHCPGTLSCISSFCLHFDITAPIVIWRFKTACSSSSHASMGRGGAAVAAGASGDARLTAASLMSPAQPRHALPLFSRDIAIAACHAVQIPAASKSSRSGLGGSNLLVATWCGRVLMLDMSASVLASIRICASPVEHLWLVDPTGVGCNTRLLQGKGEGDSKLGDDGGAYIVARTRGGCSRLYALSLSLLESATPSSSTTPSQEVRQVAARWSIGSVVLVGACSSHWAQQVVLLDPPAASQLSGDALAIEQVHMDTCCTS